MSNLAWLLEPMLEVLRPTTLAAVIADLKEAKRAPAIQTVFEEQLTAIVGDAEATRLVNEELKGL